MWTVIKTLPIDDSEASAAKSQGILETGIFLHAAAISGPGGAILLMGHSCSGKTTLSSLLSPNFPVIADDLVFAFLRENGTWAVMDGNILKSAESPDRPNLEEMFSKNGKAYPLHWIVRIFAAECTELQPLSPIKVCEYLMDAVFEIDVQRKISSANLLKKCFHTAAAMARQHQGWQLRFSLDAEKIAALLHKTCGE